MLSYKGVSVDGVIRIVGVDDPAVRRRITMDGRAENAVLQGIPKDDFTVLLKHQPRVDRASVRVVLTFNCRAHPWGADLSFSLARSTGLSGQDGPVEVGDETWLYVSRGTGTWGPPIRFLAPSELTVIELQPAPDPTESSG